MADVQKLNIGTVFRLTIKDQDGKIVDVSSASTQQIKFKKPADAVVVTQTSSFFTDGTDGIIQYTTLINDLDQAGVWEIQGFVVITLGSFNTDVKPVRIFGNL